METGFSCNSRVYAANNKTGKLANAMVNRIIDEINKSIENECYIAALTLALTLPDVCGKAEYPETTTSQRYQDWYKEFALPRFSDGEAPEESPFLSEKEIYKLRCSVFHQASSDIDPGVLKDRSDFSKKNGPPKFILKVNKTIPGNLVFRTTSIITNDSGKKETVVNEYYFETDLISLCTLLCHAAQRYYDANKNKFDFINFKLNL